MERGRTERGMDEEGAGRRGKLIELGLNRRIRRRTGVMNGGGGVDKLMIVIR